MFIFESSVLAEEEVGETAAAMFVERKEGGVIISWKRRPNSGPHG
jgi:hypothetical protein